MLLPLKWDLPWCVLIQTIFFTCILPDYMFHAFMFSIGFSWPQTPDFQLFSQNPLLSWWELTFAAETIVLVDISSRLTVTVQVTFLCWSRVFKWTAIGLAIASIWTSSDCSFNWWVTSNLAPPWDISWDKLKSSRAN